MDKFFNIFSALILSLSHKRTKESGHLRINPVNTKVYFLKKERYEMDSLKHLNLLAKEEKKKLSKKDSEMIDKIFKDDIDFLY